MRAHHGRRLAAGLLTGATLAAGVCGAAAGASAARKPRTAHVNGVITAVAPKKHRLVVRAGSATHTFKLMSDTVVMVGKAHSSVAKLYAGEHVGVMYEKFGFENLDAIAITVTSG